MYAIYGNIYHKWILWGTGNPEGQAPTNPPEPGASSKAPCSWQDLDWGWLEGQPTYYEFDMNKSHPSIDIDR